MIVIKIRGKHAEHQVCVWTVSFGDQAACFVFTCTLIRNASDTLLQVVQDHQRSCTGFNSTLSPLPLSVIIRCSRETVRRLRASHSSLASAYSVFTFHISCLSHKTNTRRETRPGGPSDAFPRFFHIPLTFPTAGEQTQTCHVAFTRIRTRNVECGQSARRRFFLLRRGI